MNRLRWLAAVVFLAALAGCAPSRNALPAGLVGRAEVVGIPDVRAWGDEYSPVLQASLTESIHQAAKNSGGSADAQGYVDILSLSGGGSDGAFGAGLLNGWSANGTRPKFKLVTGISAGALIAPFAFLGSDYDRQLKELCTKFKAEEVYTMRPLLSLLGGEQSLADTAPLARLIAKLVDEDFLAAVAKAHRQGRRLLIGTTNLDARRPVIWDMGAIAASGQPGALELFREVMRASASIPVAFPPVYIPVEADGQRYDEMHVDGGVTAQVFFYGCSLNIPAAIREAGLKQKPKMRIYVIRNSQFRVEYEQVQPRLLPIAARSLTGLTASQGVGDLYRIYTFAQRDGVDFNLIAIPSSYARIHKEEFNPEETKRLFEIAFEMGRAGIQWQKVPPGFGCLEQEQPK